MEWRLNHVGQMAQSVQDYSDIISILGGCVYIYIYFKVIESLISNILIKIILIIVGAGIGYFIILMLLGNTIVKNGIVRIWRKILG